MLSKPCFKEHSTSVIKKLIKNIFKIKTREKLGRNKSDIKKVDIKKAKLPT